MHRRLRVTSRAQGPAAPLKPQKTNLEAEQKSLSHHDYTVGWVCALPLELGAATAMLDEEHELLPVGPGDRNSYTLGRIGHHIVVLVCLPSYGTAKAATVASHMLGSFPNIQAGLMVGIGGGVPMSDADIRLGDIIVGDLVVQYDLGKTVRDGKFERIGGSGKSPPDNLTAAVQSLRGRQNLQPSQVPRLISDMLECYPSTRDMYTRPAAFLDRLFEAAYDHVEGPKDGNATPCGHCDVSRLVERPARSDQHCKIHYGKIASGNQVIKHGKTRGRLAHELGAMCFEMEAAGLVDANFPCLVIRGISDYADSHKNNQWQGFAAAAAAAYAKELLAILPATMFKDVSSMGMGMLWQSFCSLPNPSLHFSKPLLQSIAKDEAKLRALLAGEHSMTRSAFLKELQTTQLTLNESLQLAMHNLPTDKNSPRVTSQGHLSDGVSQESNLGKKMSPERLETGPVVSEFPLKDTDDIETVQSQLGSAVDTLERLGSMIQVSTKDMKVVSRSFHHDAARMALNIRRAERLFFRLHRPTHIGVGLEQMARLAHSTASTDSSIVTSLASSLQKLNCGDQFEVEDDRPVSNGAFEFKLEAPVPSRTGNSPASLDLVPREGPTGLVEHHPASQSENSMEVVTRNNCPLCGTPYELCERCLERASVSVTSSNFNFVEEEGHTYDSIASREYMLPNDDSWTSAEEVLHYLLYDLVLEKKALLGSVANFGGRVLDVGTGVGWWAMDMAYDNCRADVIGIDLSPIQPRWVPPNCRFYINDITLSYELVFACSDYYPDVIHCRSMTMAIYDWAKLITWVKRELKPVGSIEFQELLWCPCIQDGRTIKPYTGPLAEFFQTLAEAFGAVGISLDAPRYLRTGLELSGFKDVSQRDFLIPLGNWPKDPRFKQIGALFNYFLKEAIWPLSSRVLRRRLNYGPSEANLWAERFKETLKESRRELILFKFIVVHGRKCTAIR